MESGTESEIVTVTFVVVLIAVTHAGKELLIVTILDTCTPTYLIELLDRTARSICERLEPTTSRVQLRISGLAHLPGLFIIGVKAFRETGLAARNQHLVRLYIEGQEVVLVARQLISDADIHARGNEIAASIVGIRHLTTQILNRKTKREMTVTHRQLNRLTIIQAEVCRHSPCRVHLCTSAHRAVITVVEVGIEETYSNRHRDILMQFTEITEVERPLIRTYIL